MGQKSGPQSGFPLNMQLTCALGKLPAVLQRCNWDAPWGGEVHGSLYRAFNPSQTQTGPL